MSSWRVKINNRVRSIMLISRDLGLGSREEVMAHIQNNLTVKRFGIVSIEPYTARHSFRKAGRNVW